MASDAQLNRIKEIRGGKMNDYRFKKRMTGEGEFAETIHRLFKMSCDKYKLNKRRYNLSNNLFIRASGAQIELFKT